MNTEALSKIKAAFKTSAENINSPTKIFYDGKTMSLKELAQEIEDETPIGKEFIQMAENAAKTLNVSISEFAEKLAGKKPPTP